MNLTYWQPGNIFVRIIQPALIFIVLLVTLEINGNLTGIETCIVFNY